MIGASINGKHTYHDYGLVIGNNDVIGIPKVKKYLIDIPGSSHVLDLSESLTGKVEYGTRILKLQLGKTHDIDLWQSELSNFLNDVHGQSVKVIFDDDLAFYYEGRCEVINFSRTRRLGVIELSIECQPFKMEITSSSEEWLWDSLDFENSVIREYKDLIVYNRLELEVVGSVVNMTPIFFCSEKESSTIRFHSKKLNRYFELKEGMNRFYDFSIGSDGDVLTFYGRFKVSIDVRGGSL